jgi:hypothetical protein
MLSRCRIIWLLAHSFCYTQETEKEIQVNREIFLIFFMYVLYSTLLHLPPPLCRRMLGSNPGQGQLRHLVVRCFSHSVHLIHKRLHLTHNRLRLIYKRDKLLTGEEWLGGGRGVLSHDRKKALVLYKSMNPHERSFLSILFLRRVPCLSSVKSVSV